MGKYTQLLYVCPRTLKHFLLKGLLYTFASYQLGYNVSNAKERIPVGISEAAAAAVEGAPTMRQSGFFSTMT